MLTQSLFFVLLIFIPIGTKFLVYQFTPGFHEYETAFVYLSDIFLLGFLAFYLFHNLHPKSSSKSQFPNPNFQINSKSKLSKFTTPITNHKLLITIFLFFAGLSIFFAFGKGLAFYSLARLLIMVIMTFAVAEFVRRAGLFKKVLALLAILAVAQSVIGFLQFERQANLGLQILGESPISGSAPGVSKVLVHGAKLIRAYGTFPHPNIFGAFLTLGLVSLFYLYVKSLESGGERPNFKEFFRAFVIKRLAFLIAIFLVAVGLTLTFSRSSWIGAIIATAMFLLLVFLQDIKSRAFDQPGNFWLPRSIRFFGAMLAVAVFLLAALGWVAVPRAQVSPTERSIALRLDYNRLGLAIVAQRPFGVGIGNQVLYAYEHGLYQEFGMKKASDWQPVHNLYLLIASEIGVLGLLSFLIFIVLLSSRLFKLALKLETAVVLILLVTVLVLGFFDHYFWTLEQGRLMLWLVIGMVMAVINRPHSSTDRTRPSEG